MKASILFATGLMLAAGVVTGSINAAQAGEAGAAGSISAEFTPTGNNLAATAGAVAVGKNGAVTTSRTNATEISSVAFGYAGQMNVTNINGDANYLLTAENLTQLGESQRNAFGSAPNLNLAGPTSGVTLP